MKPTGRSYIIPIKYDHSAEGPFQDDLKRRIELHFADRNGSRKATAFMWAKCALFIGLFWATWAFLAFQAHSLPVTISLLVAFALLFKCVAYNVAHDAVHGALSGKSAIDDAVFWFSFNILGPNAYLWKIRHNNAHHFFTNVPGCDVDIEGTDAIRFAPHRPWWRMHRFQHLYAPVLYMVFTLHWIFIKDFQLFFRKEWGNVSGLRHSPWRFLELLALKAFYVGYMVAIPALVLPYSLSTVVAAFILFHFFLSFLVVMTFVSSHIAEEAVFVEHDEGRMPHSFLEHALRTSVDFHARSEVVGFFYGGFNSHVAHHMFPNMSSIHYGPVSRIIRDTARDHGLPYHELSLPKLCVSHFRFLKRMGASPTAGKRGTSCLRVDRAW